MWGEVMIKTSVTTKYPGRLFHCCTHGSELDNFNLFKWTDEDAVEEIEYLKGMVSDSNGEISDLRAERVETEKEFVGMKKVILELERDINNCCVVL
ncbi:hypothetical protein N665_0069s0015 [Sinapis alba]|nr:hypothetical protein N665_0069s0015 [Sinapis alba]